MGGYPKPGQENADLIDAGKGTTTTVPGSSISSSSLSFAMMRGGHLDCTVLGGM